MPHVIARSVRAALAALLLVASVGGCVVSRQSQAQATEAVTDALEQAGSAVATADLTVSLLDADRLTPAVADAALLDQVRVLEDATTALTTLVPPDGVSASVRSRGLSAQATAVLAVVSARAWVAGAGTGTGTGTDQVPSTAQEVLTMLDDAAADLDAALSLARA